MEILRGLAQRMRPYWLQGYSSAQIAQHLQLAVPQVGRLVRDTRRLLGPDLLPLRKRGRPRAQAELP